MNEYVTLRCFESEDSFYVNVINYAGTVIVWGQHSYKHKRSARRAAIALAKKLDSSYRQDLEYEGHEEPAAILAETAKERSLENERPSDRQDT